MWIRKNNVDIQHTATRLTFGANKHYGLATRNYFVSMAAGDRINLMWAVDDTRV